jgi:hypothetical protein
MDGTFFGFRRLVPHRERARKAVLGAGWVRFGDLGAEWHDFGVWQGSPAATPRNAHCHHHQRRLAGVKPVFRRFVV